MRLHAWAIGGNVTSQAAPRGARITSNHSRCFGHLSTWQRAQLLSSSQARLCRPPPHLWELCRTRPVLGCFSIVLVVCPSVRTTRGSRLSLPGSILSFSFSRSFEINYQNTVHNGVPNTGECRWRISGGSAQRSRVRFYFQIFVCFLFMCF